MFDGEAAPFDFREGVRAAQIHFLLREIGRASCRERV